MSVFWASTSLQKFHAWTPFTSEKIKKIWKFFYCPNTFFQSCFFNVSSTERVQILKFSTLLFHKLSSPPAAIRPLLYTFVFTWSGEFSSTSFVLKPPSAIPLLLCPYCFSRGAAIPLFAWQPFGNFRRFLFWFRFSTLSFNITHGPVPLEPTIRPHAVYPLHIHTSLEGLFCTNSWASSRSSKNMATCRISITHSH